MQRMLLVLLCCLCLPSLAWAANTHGTSSDQAEQRAWWGDLDNPAVVSGCAPSVPSSSLTFAAFACAGYIRGSGGGLEDFSARGGGRGPPSGGGGRDRLGPA